MALDTPLSLLASVSGEVGGVVSVDLLGLTDEDVLLGGMLCDLTGLRSDNERSRKIATELPAKR